MMVKAEFPGMKTGISGRVRRTPMIYFPPTKTAATVLLLMVMCGHVFGQAASTSQPAEDPGGFLQVCCRPLSKWSGSKNPALWGLNRMIVSHINHCFIDFGEASVVPGMNATFQTSGIHPVRSRNDNKQPIPDQITDSLSLGGSCKKVANATPEKIKKLQDELAGGTCNSCGTSYHNRVASLCFNNSNTYVYDLISGAGMTPPKMSGAPGYRRHHECGSGSAGVQSAGVR
jgi:hypothetical protein